MTGEVTKLAAIITYLVGRAPRPVGRTLLQKLIYLSDVDAYRKNARSITGLDYISYDHGPWLRELYAGIDAATGVRERRYFWRSDRPSYEYWSDRVDSAHAEDLLTADEREILDRVVGTWGHQSLETVLTHVYTSAPYEGTPFGETVDFARLDHERGG